MSAHSYPAYAVVVNTPGYLPDDDELLTYDCLSDAIGAFAGAVESLVDDGYEVLYRHPDYARLHRPGNRYDGSFLDDLGLEVEILSCTLVA